MDTVIGQSPDGELIRGATCIKCGDDFTYKTASRRTVCGACLSMNARAIAHRLHLARLEAPTPPEPPPVPDLGIPDGYRCLSDPRPCAKTECRHHLDSHATCSIREANQRGPMTLDQVAQRIGNLTRERARQIESAAIRKLRRKGFVLKVFHESE